MVKDGAVALDGLVETDWLPFPFTMNWKFTRPGVIRFEADEPFCFISLAPHGVMDEVQPKVARLEDDPKLKLAYDTWSASRADFGKRLAESRAERGEREVAAHLRAGPWRGRATVRRPITSPSVG